MKLNWRAFVVGLLIFVTAGGGAYLALHTIDASVRKTQDEKNVILYNDGFIDGENSIIDQCEKIMDPKLGTTWYECPIPVVDR